MSEKQKQIIYEYPQQLGLENTLTVSCGAEGFSVSGHSNEIGFEELEARIMRIVEKVAGKIKNESPENYHG